MSSVLVTARRIIQSTLVCGLLLTVPGWGCAATDNNASDRDAAATSRNRSAADSDAVREVERRYVVGPLASRPLGYRVDWQSSEAGSDLRVFEFAGDSVYVLDNRNFLTRLERNTGRRIWRVPVAEPVQEVISVTAISDRVYLSSGGRMIVLDNDTGSQIGLQRLQSIANTGSEHLGQFLIYGGRNGQLIWHSYATEFQWRAYQISQSINLRPLVVKDSPQYVVTVGNDGRVTVHNTQSANMVWDKMLLSRVVARPAAGNGAVYVAGLDQHLWAYNLSTGRSIWRYLTSSELRDSPVLIGDTVYQQIPDEGLVAFEARPVDAPGGRIRWTAEEIQGNVIARRGNQLYVWHRPSRTMSILDARRGGVMDQQHLRQANTVIASDIEGDELYALGDDGRIVRLLPRN